MKIIAAIFFVVITILGISGVYNVLFNQAQHEHEALASLRGKIVRAQTVEVVGFAFNPMELKILSGGSVIFVNRDRVEHSATSDDGSFDTGPLKYSDSVKISIDKPGNYSYHSKSYPSVQGRIIVE